jgi:hypothetical protein
MRKVSDKSCGENQNIHFIFNNFSVENHSVNNVEIYDRARQAADDKIGLILRMRFACWITKATDTLRLHNTYCLSTTTMLSLKHLDVMFIRILPYLLNVQACCTYVLNG